MAKKTQTINCAVCQKDMEYIKASLDKILNNHLPHIDQHVNEIMDETRDNYEENRRDIIKMAEDLSWIKKFFWTIAIPVIMAVVLGIIYALLNHLIKV